MERDSREIAIVYYVYFISNYKILLCKEMSRSLHYTKLTCSKS